MDIKSIDIISASRKGVEVDIIHPVTKESLGLKIHIQGAMTPEYKDAMNIMLAELEDFNAEIDAELGEKPTKKAQAQAKSKKDAFDAAQTAGLLARFTTGWHGMVENGKEVQFSAEEAKRIYAEYPLIRSQVQEACFNVANFLKA
jgi:hypothetical protein